VPGLPCQRAREDLAWLKIGFRRSQWAMKRRASTFSGTATTRRYVAHGKGSPPCSTRSPPTSGYTANLVTMPLRSSAMPGVGTYSNNRFGGRQPPPTLTRAATTARRRG
jgi:hypothetical protein